MRALALLLFGMAITTQAQAQYRYDCPNCGIGFGYTPPFASGYLGMNSYSHPGYWWSPYGAMSYSNFYYPGVWAGAGINSGYYPGSGGCFAAKPNLYLHGRKGVKVKVRVDLREGSSWLAAVPSHGKQGWEGELTAKANFKTGRANHSFIFYDYRLDEKKMQDKSGFCADQTNLIPKMANALEQLGFTAREIEDFKEHWSLKIPPSPKYCVYPQTHELLDKVAQLEISPKPRSIRRVLFIVVVDEMLNDSGRKFTRAPEKAWLPIAQNNDEELDDLKRAPAAESDALEVHEWGVGFLAQPKR